MKQQPALFLHFIIFVGFLFTLTLASNFFKALESRIIYKEDASLFCPKRYYQDPMNSYQCLPCSSNCENCNGPLPTDCLTRILAKTCSSSQYLYWDGNCDSSCNSPLVATTSTDSSTDNTCSYICSGSQYLYWTGTCDSTCTGLYQSSIVHNKQLCDTKCPTSYTYWDGSCGTTCDFPLTNSTLVGRNFCNFPCTSQSDFLYYDGTCASTCSYPLVNKAQKSRNFCDANCLPPQWAYWDSSCSSSCDPPVVQRVEYGRWFCDYPCATNQYLYFNGTCGPVYCPNPYIYYSTTSRNFCESPCYAAGTYLDPNDGSCSSTCSSAKYSYSINGRKICTSSCPSTYYLYWNGTCSDSCPSPYTVTGTNTCESPCYASDEYLYSDGTCDTSCDSPLTSTTEDGRKFCSSTCDSTEYLNSDGSCSTTCNSPNVASTTHGNKICTEKCETGEYKYWDGSCESSCDSPLTSGTSGTTKTCSYKCTSSQYLYYNGSCETSCDSPLVSTTTHGSYLCDSPCTSSGQYLYWDGTCSSSCASPLVKSTDSGRNFCTYPCDSSTEYLKSDGSCSTACNSPYVITHYKSVNFCLSPCDTGKYRYFNNSCLSSCNSPLVTGTKNGELYCDYPCVTSEYLYYDGSCKISCPSPYQAKTEAGYKYCDKKSTTSSDPTSADGDDGFLKKVFLLAPTEAGATSLVCLVKIMHYIRYLDIEMPPRLERLVQSQPRNILTLQYGATMPSEITDGFGEYSLIPVFQKPGNHSSFFVNYFQTFTSIAIALFVGFCLQFLEKFSMKKGYKTWQAIFEVLRVIFKWNFCLILLAFNIDFIILYTFLEFDTAGRSLGSGLPNFSLATDIFMILTGVIFLIGLIYLIRKIYQTTARVAPEPTINTASAEENQDYLIVTGRWQGFRVLYTGFKETSKVARYFYLIYTIRIGLPIVLACGLYHFPMINTTLQAMISVYFLVFILIVRPIKKKINTIQLILFETLAFMMNFCIFYLTAINTYDYDAQGSRVRLGDAVIIGNSLMNLLSLIFLALKLSLELKVLIPLLPKMTKHEKYASFAKLFLILVQQGAMGFESIFDELTPTGSTKNPHNDQIATVNTETGLKNSSRIKKRGAAFPTLSTEGDLQTQGDNTFDDYARTTRRLKDMTPGTGRIFNDNASQIGLKDNISQLGGRGASADTEDTSCVGTQGDASPTLRKGNKQLSFADGAGPGGNSKGNSKIFTPQKNFEPLFVHNKSSPGNKFRSNIKKEPYYNYNKNASSNNNGGQGGQNQGMNNTSIHPYSASSAFSLDISDNSPQMRQPGLGNRRFDRTGTDLLASGTSKIYEEERGASEVDDDQLNGKAARWNYSYHTAVSQNLERDYNLPPEEEIHSKMQRKGTWQYWKAKGREKKPEKSVFEYSDVTITK